MSLKYVFLHFFCISLYFSFHLNGQERKSDTIPELGKAYNSNYSLKSLSDSVWKNCTSPFIELLGKGFLTVNVDFRWSKSHALSIGLMPFEGLAPDIMYYYISGKRHRLEVGSGLTIGFSKELNPATILIHGVIGYRNQHKKGLFFRAGITPLYVIILNDPEAGNKLYPFVGLSLGYSF